MQNRNHPQDLVELSIPDQIDLKVRALGHSQNTSGNSLPQFPPLLLSYPSLGCSEHRIQVGSGLGYHIGGVGSYSIEIPEEPGLSLSSAWRLTALVLLNTAKATLPDILDGLRGSVVLETALSIDSAYRLGASHAKSRTEWLARQPIRTKAFPRLYAERVKCENDQSFELDIFQVMPGYEQAGGRWGDENARSFRFQTTPLGIGYAYALRLLICKRISPPGGRAQELIAAFFAWWRSLCQEDSRLALHLLLSDGKPLAYAEKPSYDYLSECLGAALGKFGSRAHKARADITNRKAAARFIGHVNGLPKDLLNLRNHYEAALLKLKLPTVLVNPLKRSAAPVLRRLAVDQGETPVLEVGGTRPPSEVTVQAVNAIRPNGEFIRPNGEGNSPGGDSIRSISFYSFSWNGTSSLNTSQQSGKQSSIEGTKEPETKLPACLPAGDIRMEPRQLVSCTPFAVQVLRGSEDFSDWPGLPASWKELECQKIEWEAPLKQRKWNLNTPIGPRRVSKQECMLVVEQIAIRIWACRASRESMVFVVAEELSELMGVVLRDPPILKRRGRPRRSERPKSTDRYYGLNKFDLSVVANFAECLYDCDDDFGKILIELVCELEVLLGMEIVPPSNPGEMEFLPLLHGPFPPRRLDVLQERY